MLSQNKGEPKKGPILIALRINNPFYSGHWQSASAVCYNYINRARDEDPEHFTRGLGTEPLKMIHQKGMHLNHDFYVVVGKQCRIENAYTVTNTISLYKLIQIILLFSCFKLVMKLC